MSGNPYYNHMLEEAANSGNQRCVGNDKQSLFSEDAEITYNL
jgi:hypothetical protein